MLDLINKNNNIVKYFYPLVKRKPFPAVMLEHHVYTGFTVVPYCSTTNGRNFREVLFPSAQQRKFVKFELTTVCPTNHAHSLRLGC